MLDGRDFSAFSMVVKSDEQDYSLQAVWYGQGTANRMM